MVLKGTRSILTQKDINDIVDCILERMNDRFQTVKGCIEKKENYPTKDICKILHNGLEEHMRATDAHMGAIDNKLGNHIEQFVKDLEAVKGAMNETKNDVAEIKKQMSALIIEVEALKTRREKKEDANNTWMQRNLMKAIFILASIILAIIYLIKDVIPLVFK